MANAHGDGGRVDEEEEDDDDLPGLEALFADPPADTICGASGRIYRSKTLGVYAVYDEPRRFCIRTVESPFFDPLILLFTPLYYTETPRLSSFYRSITSRAWQKRLGVREACRAPVHPNLTALVPWHMHSMPPALHSSVGGGAGDHSYMTFLKMLAKGLIK